MPRRPVPPTLIVFALVGALEACATGRVRVPPGFSPEPGPSPTPAVPSPAPAGALSPALRWFRGSAEYRALALQTYALATSQVEAAAKGLTARSWAVILDVDETVLDNSPFQKEQELSRQPYSEDAWQAWVRRREAAPIPGARAFLERVGALGGVVAIVTNRMEAVCDDTRATLRDRLLPFDVMLCRPEGSSSDKSPRFEAVSRGTAVAELPPLEVIAYVGDNIRDFPLLDQQLRLGPDEAFADFGTRFFLLPNPLYGSWEQNPPR